MPPFVGRNRQRSPVSLSAPDSPKKKASPKRKKVAVKKKPTVSEVVGTGVNKTSAKSNRKLPEQLDDSDSSSLSGAGSDEFEDELPAKKQKVAHDDSDEDIDWEDALPEDNNTLSTAAPTPSGDLELTFSKNQASTARALTDSTKKGPSKIERQIRIATHCMHVQLLLFSYLIRNGWACDGKAQKILVAQLPPNLTDRVEQWRLASGLVTADKDEGDPKRKQEARKGKGAKAPRKQRDWGDHAVRQEAGVADMSHGDPLPRLLKELVAYWKRDFRVTAPALRKQGYKPMNVLQEEIASYNNDPHDPEQQGERIQGRSEFRRCAKNLEGSRDIGSQLFTCLLRGLGIEARLVASLQPVGFGWSKTEEAVEKRPQRVIESEEDISFDTDDDSTSAESEAVKKTTASLRSALATPTSNGRRSAQKCSTQKTPPKSSKPPIKRKPARRQPTRGSKDIPIDLDNDGHISIDSDSSELSDAQSVSSVGTDELAASSGPRRKLNASFDRDMVFPNCWVEAVSPITHQVIPIDPMVNFTVATHEEHLTAFEPRGKKADKAKQVLAYVVAYNADGSAKDVTTRYLKRRQWPGKTKGMRIPVEKVPVYNRRGKVQRYEKYDWFKRVMSGYARPDADQTQADELEDQSDLQPLQITKSTAEKPVGEIETLAGYKQSAEFVLERHLRRDEALLPHAKPVRHFTPTTSKSSKNGASNGSSTSKNSGKPEPVYRRVDVVSVKTAESWHKEGRAILPGAQPLKTAPIRAVTLARKREVEEATRTHGAAPTQGLYSKEQTDWIVPEPIRDGKIPKNAYGTIDVFVPRMVPEGAAHVPFRGSVKACKKVGCDFAEAVIGFEFGNRRAVPINQGVVVAVEWADALIEEIQRDEEAKRIKEDAKRTTAAVGMWRKFVMGLRIVERVRAEYGPDQEGADERNPFLSRTDEDDRDEGANLATEKKGKKKVNGTKSAAKHETESIEDNGGGFVVEKDDDQEGGGFLVTDPADGSEEEEKEEEEDGSEDDEDEDEDEDMDSEDDDEYEE
jgi:xeroderma pigmentosum group C-complementing protein